MFLCYYVCMSTVRFSRVYCYMKLQGYLRLFNVTRINYTINLLSLLTDTPTLLYSYCYCCVLWWYCYNSVESYSNLIIYKYRYNIVMLLYVMPLLLMLSVVTATATALSAIVSYCCYCTPQYQFLLSPLWPSSFLLLIHTSSYLC